MTTAAGASKALRGATNRLGKKLRIKVRHTNRPRADFDRLLTNVRDPAKVAEHYYKMGLRRGLILATDYVVDGTFELGKDGMLLSSDKVKADVRLGLPGQATAKPRTFKFDADDIGFDS